MTARPYDLLETQEELDEIVPPPAYAPMRPDAGPPLLTVDGEAAFIARLLENPAALGEAPALSSAAVILIGLLQESIHNARVDLLQHTLVQLRVARLGRRCWLESGTEPAWEHRLRCRRAARYRDVVRLARLVAVCAGQKPAKGSKAKRKRKPRRSLVAIHADIAKGSIA